MTKRALRGHYGVITRSLRSGIVLTQRASYSQSTVKVRALYLRFWTYCIAAEGNARAEARACATARPDSIMLVLPHPRAICVAGAATPTSPCSPWLGLLGLALALYLGITKRHCTCIVLALYGHCTGKVRSLYLGITIAPLCPSAPPRPRLVNHIRPRAHVTRVFIN